jgi:hypothetical protein
MRKLGFLLLSVGLLALTGCGGSGDEGFSNPDATTASAGAYGTAEQERAYDTAKAVCEGLGVKRVARQFGGGTETVEVAMAYSEGTFAPSAQSAATDGCRTGFGEEP